MSIILNENRNIVKQPNDDLTTPQAATDQPTTAPTVSKPSWMSDDDYKEATTHYSPEEINRIYEGYDPNSTEPFYSNLYKTYARKPKPISEKAAKSRRTFAGIADALSLVVKGVSANSGAYISKPEGPTNMDATSAKLQRLKDVYKVDQDRYNAGLYDSTVRDIENGRMEHGRKRADLISVLRDARNRRYADARLDKQLKAKAAYETQNNAYQYAKDERDATERERHNKATEGISYTKAKADAEYKAKNKSVIDSVTAPRGYVDLVDVYRGKTYRINEKTLKYNIGQLYNLIKPKLIKEDEEAERYGSSRRIDPSNKPSINEQHEIVKRYMYEYKDVMKMVKGFSAHVIDDSDLMVKQPKKEEHPIVMESKPTYNGPLRYIQELSKEENNAIVDMKTNREVAKYLMDQKWTEQQVTDIFKKNKAIRR